MIGTFLFFIIPKIYCVEFLPIFFITYSIIIVLILKEYSKMDWRKMGLFVLFFIIGVSLFFIISIFTYISLFFHIFFIAYVIILISILKEYSKKKVVTLVLLVIIYFLIMIFPFPECDQSSFFSYFSQKCTCIGLKKHSWLVMDSYYTECVGIPIDYICYITTRSGIKEEIIPCGPSFRYQNKK